MASPRLERTTGVLGRGQCSVVLLIACDCRREGKGTADSAMMESPLLESTGSRGHCVTFSYSISGLSADRLRVLLHPVQQGEDPDTPDLSQASCRDINTGYI